MAPSHASFRRFGLFTAERFLDGDTCSRLRSAAAASALSKSEIVIEGRRFVEEQYRKSRSTELPPQTRSSVIEHLTRVRPALEEHFGVPLEPDIEPELLSYSVGDFFCLHCDNSHDPSELPYILRRAVSVVIFLNGEAAEPEEGRFCGGSLIFYRLMTFPNSDQYGLPLKGEEGLLAAFPADIPHRVAPVTFGRRYTVVGWFGGPRVPKLAYRGDEEKLRTCSER